MNDSKQNPKFKNGDVVYLKSDLLKRCPMTIEAISSVYIEEERVFQYSCAWFSSSKKINYDTFLEPLLIK